MNEIDILAQQFHSYGDRSLSDYFVAMLPCQILHLDALMVEKRPLPTPTEFVLKAIRAGVTSSQDISGFLGLTDAYTEKLLAGLKQDYYVGLNEFGKWKLFRRANEALTSDGERHSIDKTVSILWDPILASPIQQRIDLHTQKAAERAGKIWKLPNSFHTPDVASLNSGDVENYLSSVQNTNNNQEKYEILRIVAIKKTLFRFRQVIVLIFEKNGSLPIFKVVASGKIDDRLSNEIAQKDGAKFIGLDGSFSRKSGSLAVNERHRQLPVTLSAEKTLKVDIAALIRQRSVLMFAINSLKNRISEEPSDSLKEKLAAKEVEYADIERSLIDVAIVPIFPFDIPLALASALSSNGKVLTITTTMPSQTYFTAPLQVQMQKALAGGMKIKIYIAGRLEEGDEGKGSPGSALASLNKIANEYNNLEVFFLKKQQRQVFEIYLENSNLVFCNASPLGDRLAPFSPRAFRGYQISCESQITSYVESHLSFSPDDIIQRIHSGKLGKQQKERNRNTSSAKR